MVATPPPWLSSTSSRINKLPFPSSLFHARLASQPGGFAFTAAIPSPGIPARHSFHFSAPPHFYLDNDNNLSSPFMKKQL